MKVNIFHLCNLYFFIFFTPISPSAIIFPIFGILHHHLHILFFVKVIVFSRRHLNFLFVKVNVFTRTYFTWGPYFSPAYFFCGSHTSQSMQWCILCRTVILLLSENYDRKRTFLEHFYKQSGILLDHTLKFNCTVHFRIVLD